MLELAYRADSNSAARKGLWVRPPPAVPLPIEIECRATPPDTERCAVGRSIGPDYAYLLGLYLGDGWLSRHRRHVWRLRISLDASYPAIIEAASSAIGEVASRVPQRTARPGCVEVHSDWKHWICLFPQHGAGPKHLRPIRLEAWQATVVEGAPGQFLRGMIHSDGCRSRNVVKGRDYPRYFFSNVSSDIRGLFVWACGLVGVECRQANARNISVARRASVAILDMLVGPKGT